MKFKNILNTLFLIGLITLIINDHLLKDLFGNWFTGKLSDFAGILILPLFLKIILPISNRNALIATVLMFVYWKSPYSQPAIDAFNSLAPFQIGRVIDYSDFLAFLMLPVSAYILKHPDKLTLKTRFARELAMGLVLPITIFAFVATSQEDDFPPFDPSIASCCQSVPLETTIGNGKIFVPTIFTPDGNGTNDFFQVSADTNILRIDTFIVYELMNYDTVFYAVDMTEITPVNGFDGQVLGSIPPATYSYVITITSKDGNTGTVNGEVCSVPCSQPLNLPRPVGINTCGFATQHSFETGFDPNIPSGESLDCFD